MLREVSARDARRPYEGAVAGGVSQRQRGIVLRQRAVEWNTSLCRHQSCPEDCRRQGVTASPRLWQRVYAQLTGVLRTPGAMGHTRQSPLRDDAYDRDWPTHRIPVRRLAGI